MCFNAKKFIISLVMGSEKEELLLWGFWAFWTNSFFFNLFFFPFIVFVVAVLFFIFQLLLNLKFLVSFFNFKSLFLVCFMYVPFNNSLFKNIDWLIDLLLCCVFVAAHRLSLVAASGGYSLLWCVGFSLRWLLLLWSTGSRHTGFRSCGTRAQ